MSRGQANELQNPATRSFEWASDKKCFTYFDKSKGEKGEKVEVPLPFKFLVLDRLSTIKGFSDHHQSGFWANEIKSTKKEVLSVYTKKGLAAEGFYKDIIGTSDLTGAKFCQVVYIAYYEGKELSIGKINMVGTALSSWIDFSKGNNIEVGAIEVASMIEGKKGKTVYQTPVFAKIEVSKETDEKAVRLNLDILQPYLSKYLASHTESAPAQVETVAQNSTATIDDYKKMGRDESQDDIPSDEPSNSLPF